MAATVSSLALPAARPQRHFEHLPCCPVALPLSSLLLLAPAGLEPPDAGRASSGSRPRRSAAALPTPKPRGGRPGARPAPRFPWPFRPTWNLLPEKTPDPSARRRGPAHVPRPRVSGFLRSGKKSLSTSLGVTEARNPGNLRTPPNLAKPLRPLPRPPKPVPEAFFWHPRLNLLPSPAHLYF